MDKAGLVSLLEQSQIPDTEKVKAVTAALQKNYYSQPGSLLLLIEVALTHENPGIRQLAAVQALRISRKHWDGLPEEQKDLARKHLLEGALKEPKAVTRHSQARLLATLAHLDLANETGEELLRTVIGLNTKGDVSSREVGSYILYVMLENDPTYFVDHIHQLFELFGRTINDAESKDVCVNTIKSVGALLIVVEPEEDEQSLQAVQKLFPSMIRILQASIDSDSTEHTKDIFEVLQSFLAYDSALLSQHLKDLIQFMIELASNSELDDDARTLALSFLAQCVHARRMKIQGMKDVGSLLMRKAIAIVAEVEDDIDEDDIDESSPVRAALALIDQLSSDLPPRQVINPLLEDFPKLAQHSKPGYRRAGILCLGTAAEGAPDFISTQLMGIFPSVVSLLNDPVDAVRHDALIGFISLADEMAEDFAPHQEAIFEALFKNLKNAVDQVDKKNVGIIRAVCGVLDSLGHGGLDGEVIKTYGRKLIPPLGTLLGHADYSVKAAAASAIGSIALSLGDDFKPFFSDVVTAFGPFLVLKDGEESLTLRSAVSDSMGRIATAVGAETFQPYVMDLMKASEEGLHLDNARLKETSFMLWGSLAKIYGEHFAEFLPGVFDGLRDVLELEEEEIAVDSLVEGAEEGDVLVIGGKRIRIKKSEPGEDDDVSLSMGDDEDWDDIDDFTGATAIALQQEIAIEVLGEVITECCDSDAIRKYLEPTLEKILPFTDHSFEGCRKAAISTLWRSYARVWKLCEETPWTPGSPAENPMPNAVVAKIAELICKATLSIWLDDTERAVVTEINQCVNETLKVCGPAILGVGDLENQVISVVASIITKSHPCQQDLGDEEDGQDLEGGSSEFDWLVIDSALDVIVALAQSLGPHFAKHWKVLQKPVIKYASSQEGTERSTAAGVIAEAVRYMGSAVTPFTAPLMKILIHRLSDTEALAKSNAAFAVGQLIINSEDPNVFQVYEEIVYKLEPAILVTDSRLQDNIAGCFSRMMIKKPDAAIVSKLLPLVIGVLPLKEDFEENVPIFECIFKLYEKSDPTVVQATAQLVPIFKAVLGEPEEQLDQETREKVQKIGQHLHQSHPQLFA